MPSEYEAQQIQEIEDWKNREPKAISRFGERFLGPLTTGIIKVVPESAMLKAMELGNASGEVLAHFQRIKQKAGISEYSELLSRELSYCDQLATNEQKWAIGIAAAEGGASGWFGLPGLAVDTPMIVALAMRSIHLMGLCYGFELKNSNVNDRELAMGILSASGANSMREKVEALQHLHALHTTSAQLRAQEMGVEAGGRWVLQIVVLQVTKNLARRKIVQSIPGVGSAVGATVNGWYIRDVCHTARRVFQERWLRKNEII